MTSSFADLKSARKSSLEALISETSKLNSNEGGASTDDRWWKPEVDKAGNGYAVIRFLPAPQGEDLPWVRIFNHGFQGSGGWYIEESLTTINKKDPVSEYNSMLWNSGIESNKDLVRKQKRRLNYYANIYVVKDPTNPQHEGKVFLYKFGKKIFDKLNEAMNPEFEDEKPVNPFDLWEGANFKLKIRNVESYRNYDKSEFDTPSPLLDDDSELEKIWKSEYPLKEFLDPKNFKSYDELKSKMNRVLGLDGSSSGSASVDEIEIEDSPRPKSTAAPSFASSNSDSDDDDSMSFFEKLASDD
jgi:hypothetical protein